MMRVPGEMEEELEEKKPHHPLEKAWIQKLFIQPQV